MLADGANSLSNLVSAATEKTTRRVLDWFHISMRLRPIEQTSPVIASIVGMQFESGRIRELGSIDDFGVVSRILRKRLSSVGVLMVGHG